MYSSVMVLSGRAGKPTVCFLCVLGAVVCGLTIPARMCEAADKSGVTPNTVSLPQGPGSIRGLGEMFEPDLSTGTAKYRIELDVSAGPAGFAPGLVLEYDGGNGNGPLGYGWRINVPHIQRKTSKGVPRYVDGANGRDDDGDGLTDEPDEIDMFINNYPQGLVPGADGYYFMEKEGAFVRYRRVDDYWEGTLPDGTRMEFGRTEQARISDPSTGGIFCWKLERMVDTHGNTIVYSYRSFPGDQNSGRKYISKIEYGPGAAGDISNGDNRHFVTFTYEERPDWFETCRPGFVLRTGMRLKEIIVGTQGPELDGHAAGDFNDDGLTDYLNRKYLLSYDAHPHWSLLTSVTLVGADGSSMFPPTKMAYTVCNPAATLSAVPSVIGSADTPIHLMNRDWVEMSDLNGDGLPDILKTEPFGGMHTAFLNQGETDTGAGRVIQWGSPVGIGGDGRVSNVDLAESSGVKAYLADMNADGRADLVYTADANGYYFPNEVGSGGPRWGERTRMDIHPESPTPSSPYGTEHVKTADLNGDKLIDIIQSVSVGGLAHYRVWMNLGGQRYSKSVTVPHDFGFMLSNEGVNIADFNGDNLPDVVQVRPTGVVVTAGLGYGRFASPVTVLFPNSVLDMTHVDKAALQDITGDGLVDLVIEGPSAGLIWYWINRGNYSFEEKRVVTDTPTSIGADTAIRWADINGNGTRDLIYAGRMDGARLQTIDLGELLGCVPSPNLLVRIENGIGGTTTIEYETSTRFLLEDATAGNVWPDPLPFPVDVVARVVTDDSLGNLYTTELRYHDGYYNAALRLFSGFARTDEIVVGDSDAPTLVTRSVFDTGRDVFAMRGNLRRRTAETEDGSVFRDEMTEWAARVLMTGIDGREVVFPHAVLQIRDITEGGRGSPRRLESAFTYDDYGNMTVHSAFGIVENGDRGAFADERITLTDYAYNIENWLVRYPLRRETRDYSDNVIARTETYYDDETFSGTNFGEVTVGNVTLVSAWYDPGEPNGYVDTQRFKYDEYGNPVRLLDPLAEATDGALNEQTGHYRTVEYDSQFHTYPVRETIHVGDGKENLVVEVDYDDGLGIVTSYIDMNGHETTYGYDAFGRFVWSVRPGDTPEFPTVEYEYRLAEPADVAGSSNQGLVNFVETRLLDREPGSAGTAKRDHYFISRDLFDGLGRMLMEKEEFAPDPVTGAPRVAVTDATRFNARMKPAQVLQPYLSLLPADDLDSLLVYEHVTSPGWQGAFHQEAQLAGLGYIDAQRTSSMYDAMLRVVQTVNTDGTQQINVYEPLAVVVYDENDTDSSSPFFDTPVVQYTDGQERLIQVDEVVRLDDDGTSSDSLNTWTTSYEYRADGVLTRIVDAQGSEKWMEYDGLGRKTFMNDPDRGIVSYTYDAAGNLIECVDAKEQRTSYTYDGCNRIMTVDYHDEGLPFSAGRSYDPSIAISDDNRPDVVYHYDGGAGVIDLGYDQQGAAADTMGRLAYVVALSGEEHPSYDEPGRG